MKLIFEVLLSILLHPVALFLMVLNILGRNDLTGPKKIAWTLAGLVWGLGPILYILVGDGALW